MAPSLQLSSEVKKRATQTSCYIKCDNLQDGLYCNTLESQPKCEDIDECLGTSEFNISSYCGESAHCVNGDGGVQCKCEHDYDVWVPWQGCVSYTSIEEDTTQDSSEKYVAIGWGGHTQDNMQYSTTATLITDDLLTCFNHRIPPLEPGLLGAAMTVLGDWLYVCGGTMDSSR